MNTATIPDLADLFQLSAPLSDKRIVVAMSGGVDSSVVAALAARSGAEVIGVTLQLYDRVPHPAARVPAVPGMTSAMPAASLTGSGSSTT
jgi:hypothetical protein